MAKSFRELQETHPCFGNHSATTGRIHLPVCPGCNLSCRFCERSINTTENRPGVTSTVLKPAEAVPVLRKALVTRIVSTKRVYSPKCYLPERFDTNGVTCVFGRFEIPNDHDSVTFAVRPMNAWGRPGRAIESPPATYDKAKVLYPY